MDKKYPVSVNLYDLSGGMAKSFSLMFLGKQLDGIWHTGLVVYGKEFYFGGGICQGPPKQTPYGFPVQEIPLGETELPEEIFDDFLNEIRPKFTMDTYDLFKNNCNNFTNACAQFLTGQNIPEHITGLPDEVLKTPMGQMLKPMIDQMQNNVVQQSAQAQLFPNANNQPSQQQQQPSQNQFGFGMQQNMFGGGGGFGQQQPNAFDQNLLNAFGGFQGLNQPQFQVFNSNAPQQQQQQQGFQQGGNQQHDLKKVIVINNFNEFIQRSEEDKHFIIDFTATWCRPCQMIKPFFIQYSEQYPEIKFYQVDADKNKELCKQFGITGYPTFITFYDGNIKFKFSGANQAQLKTQLDALKDQINQK